ncbi:hypothetical protein EVAR_92924_1 [Eumeta japonica]|uniref:Secreted protein n=1 Tax=Eumeta variegata TaxID=151549 RepID=A0A4C1TDE4_EUMVA|nr:hypothetical protein EVAR_92924_1 [Eumeta japonica]
MIALGLRIPMSDSAYSLMLLLLVCLSSSAVLCCAVGSATGAQAQGVDSGGRKIGQTRQNYYFFGLLHINSHYAPSARVQTFFHQFILKRNLYYATFLIQNSTVPST